VARRVRQEDVNPEALVKEFEQKLERLRVLYEQYFMGIQKRPPTIPMHEVVRVQFQLDKLRINNHGLRYRYRSLVQRLNTYRTYWNRTLRAIENGTYHRDLARLRRKLRREGLDVHMPTSGRLRSVHEVERAMTTAMKKRDEAKNPPPAAKEAPKKRRAVPTDIRGASGEELKKVAARHVPGQADRPAAPVARVAGRPAGGSAMKSPPGMSQAQMQSIFRRYLKAKRMVGEDPGKVRYDKLVRTISGQLPQLREMNRGRSVDFDVVIREGKVVLKAKPT
jgi:hypothetical protein